MFPFKLEVLSCFTVLFSSLGFFNEHRRTLRAFLPEATDGYPTWWVVNARDWPCNAHGVC